MDDDVLSLQNNNCEFDELCADIPFRNEDEVDPELERGSWDLLDGNILARIFHFLGADVKSLFYSALTCKHWRSVVKYYKDISRQIDFCAIGSNCSDSIILKIMVTVSCIACLCLDYTYTFCFLFDVSLNG